jgi:hypothetical protein
MGSLMWVPYSPYAGCAYKTPTQGIAKAARQLDPARRCEVTYDRRWASQGHLGPLICRSLRIPAEADTIVTG